MNKPEDRVIGRDELEAMIPYDARHLLQMEKAGDFPKRIVLGRRKVGWSLLEIQNWIERRKALRAS